MAASEEKLNRIYQGRVCKVSVTESDGNTAVSSDGDKLLFEHHQLYQDAVNYYLVALSAMALDDEKSLWGKLRIQLKNVWNDFSHHGTVYPGLKYSMIRTLGHADLLDSAAGLDEAMRLILCGNNVNPQILNAALEHIAAKCQGNVSQPAKTYFPQLCTEFNGNYDLDEKAILGDLGKKKLLDALRSENPVAEIVKIAPEMEMNWCGIKTQTGKFFKDTEAQAELRKAVNFFKDDLKTSQAVKKYLQENGKDKLEEYLQKSEALTDISFGRNNRAELNHLYAMWLLKFFPDSFTVGLMQAIISPKENVVLKDAPPWGDDPIKLSRGQRGYVFPAFTALPMWKSPWRTFDMAAFTDALKTINQYNGKMREREEMLHKYRLAVDWMEGKNTSCKSPALPDAEESEDAESENVLPVLAGDSRWEALQQLLNELGVQNDFTEGELVDYGISMRTIRGFNKLRPGLLKLEDDARQKCIAPESLTERLQAEVILFQTKNRETMGSAALFQKLMELQYQCIWHDLKDAGKYSSRDILSDAVRYYSYLEEVSRLEEPIHITPADARYSRRCSDLRALVYDNAKGYQKGFGFQKDGTLAVQIAGKCGNKYDKCKVILAYSAPRLRRDGLIGGEFAKYYPPAVQAFYDEKNADKQDFATTSVSLMPDWDKNGKMRILLNFATSLDVAALHLQADTRFVKQFYYGNNTNYRLLWPSDSPKHPLTWANSTQPFSFVAVDLGQRTAGALSRIEVSTVKQNHAVKIGEQGGNSWYACRRYSELLRLPGEDAQILRDGKRVREFSGSRGRKAEQAETEEAQNICRSLVGDDDLLRDNAEKVYIYFPKQNDRLLLALRRSLARLKQMQRWLWLQNAPEMREKIQSEMQECLWLKDKKLEVEAARLREELPKQLMKIANRILPLRGRHWSWIKLDSTGTYLLKQTAMGTDDFHKKICGQRGLSFSRLEQLESLRIRCQSLNRLLMRELGEKPAGIAEMRKQTIPDCCPDILRRLDAMKEQRVNQTANMILAQALGIRHKVHTIDSGKRLADDIHGEYELIPGVQRAAFVVLENLSRYRFSQDRSPYENSRLMKWSHRQILEKIKLLCEVFAIPVVEVNAAYSSKFSSNGIPGFRAEECSAEDLSVYPWDKVDDVRQNELLVNIRSVLQKMNALDSSATAIMPRNGGPIFIPVIASDNNDTLLQADINASFNIGLRAVADKDNCLLNNRLSVEKRKNNDIWVVKKCQAKWLEKAEIAYSPKQKLSGGGNFFVLNCPLFWEDENKQPAHFTDPELNKRFPHLMFGSFLWRNTLLQLERCLKINEQRLNRLKDKIRHE